MSGPIAGTPFLGCCGGPSLPDVINWKRLIVDVSDRPSVPIEDRATAANKRIAAMSIRDGYDMSLINNLRSRYVAFFYDDLSTPQFVNDTTVASVTVPSVRSETAGTIQPWTYICGRIIITDGPELTPCRVLYSDFSNEVIIGCGNITWPYTESIDLPIEDVSPGLPYRYRTARFFFRGYLGTSAPGCCPPPPP